jgi:phosphopantothenate-cysteine ligase/phosphopantothenoylcysteine decarboxylase/phosphopantothenate--cysteine ligase
MRILVTAGNTQTPIDQVRCITNIFTGRTGTWLALAAFRRGHEVCLLTSHPEVVRQLSDSPPSPGTRWQVQPYRTFEDLHALLRRGLEAREWGDFDAVIHCAAVSDYTVQGIYQRLDPVQPTRLEDYFADVNQPKVSSSHPEMWLRLVPTPKLVDQMRSPWNFQGVLVKFKLEVGVSEEQLLEIAERSRRHSAADLMAANTLEGMQDWAYLGPLDGQYERLERASLASRLLDAVEEIHRQKGMVHG